MHSKDTHAPSNESLLAASADGDRSAFQQLYRQTSGRLYAYLSRLLNNSTLVDDVFVDVYSEIWKCAGHFAGNSSALTWMIGVARNLAMNHLKKQRHYESLEHAEHRISVEDDSDHERQEKIRLIHAALAQLKPQHREILGLVLLKECSYQMVADVLGIPLNTAKTRVFYARDMLRKKLVEMGVTEDDL
jgi:RNA polymerase sigma-70 factor (ECF subfamily)